MKWIDRLERKYGRYALSGLTRIIAAFMALVYIISKVRPDYLLVIDLEPDLVMKGQVWRLVTYIFIPQLGGFLGNELLRVILYLWFLIFVGDGLEEAMGAAKVNAFYLLGMIGTTIAAFFFGSNFSNVLLNASLFYAYARFYPEQVIYIFYILPAKVKWIAWFSGALLLFGFVVGGMAYRMAVIAALGNYLVFFGREVWEDARHRKYVSQRRKKFEKAFAKDDDALHRCTVCNRTEITNPELEFRVSADGNDYCVEHLPGKDSGGKS